MRIPADWHEIAQGPVVPPKDKLTLKLDDEVLRAFMLVRLAEVVKARPDYRPTPQDEERQIKDELFALMTAREEAREAAVARLRDAPREKARLEAARALRARHLSHGG